MRKEETNKVKVVDKIMGSKKTTFAIQYINDNLNGHYLHDTMDMAKPNTGRETDNDLDTINKDAQSLCWLA